VPFDEPKTLAKQFGYMPHFFWMFAGRPGLNSAINQLEQAITYGGSGLGRFREELIAFYVSAINGCHYCMASHGEFLKRLHGDESIVFQLLQSGDATALSDLDRAMLHFVRKVTLEPASITEEDTFRLFERRMPDDEILAVIYITSWFAFCNRMADATGLQVEHFRRDRTSCLR